jgi:hypothetical protein
LFATIVLCGYGGAQGELAGLRVGVEPQRHGGTEVFVGYAKGEKGRKEGVLKSRRRGGAENAEGIGDCGC